MARGILGFKRLSSFGPLTYSDSAVDGTDEVEEKLIEVLDERGIESANEIDQDEIIDIADDLTRKIYPEGGTIYELGDQTVLEEQIFRRCLVSNWADLWSNGFTSSTTGSPGSLEELIIRANGCAGIAGAGGSGLRVILST